MANTAPRPPQKATRSGGFWLLILSLLAALLALVTQAGAVARQAQMAEAGRPLAEALLTRARTGFLPAGPGTPGIYALARAADESAGSAARRLEIDRRLREAADALATLPAGRRLYGIALGAQGDYRRAQEALQAVADQDIFAALALGNVLDEQGQLDAARQVWQPLRAERALSLQLYRAGTALANQGRRSQGEVLLQRAIAIDPTNANAYHALGGFYWAQDRAKSLEMYRAALAMGGLEPFFERFAAGRVAFIEGRLDDAAVALEEAVRLQPEHSDAVVLLGTTLSRLGRLEEAISYLENAARQSPRAFWPWVELGRLYVQLGEYERAIEALTTAAGRRANVPQTFELLAEAYQGAGRPEQAINAWQQAVTLSPDNALYQARLGDVLAEVGRENEAIAAYRRALAINPNNGPARRGLQALGVEP